MEMLRSLPTLSGHPPGELVDDPARDPVDLFTDWLEAAIDAGVPEPHAMTLSTVGEDGVPDARVLILKGVDTRGFAFASTASSRKGRQLAAHPVAAMTFWWQPLLRSVRVSGHVTEASPEETAADLAARSAEARADVAEGDWRLWRLVPERIEFWQGSTDRRHQRVIRERWRRRP
ncbi:pyridoxamine-phosphate oxidase [Corynebacterium humireducens NBRC 106098 = DSM 45392]|uniref:Pyridoxamine-phosphate oxidase n=1 Tax=Corynebacterium humireducens NBRC 106098 = DSM 45392 TaxID=1223515 RepID=A0A0B5D388_9CORY|nr:pyridoxamine 5'-phosphate oxidase family protein [Corynebacterium humireducens]AJE33251.1 pyridoxamine-phosphate oxidase [Corynebacterium humireducens NBRC 106098 = DSM 45392]